VTSSWFFILQPSKDARSNKHQIHKCIYFFSESFVSVFLLSKLHSEWRWRWVQQRKYVFT